MRLTNRRIIYITIVMIVFLSMVAINIGSVSLSIKDVYMILVNRLLEKRYLILNGKNLLN